MSRFSSLQQKRQTLGRHVHPSVFKAERHENKLFVYLTCLYIIIWYLQLGSRIDILGTVRFEFILGAFLSAAALVKLLNQQEQATPLKGPIIFYYAVLLFYTVFSYDHATSWDIFFNRVFKFSMIALFFAAFIQTPWALRLAVGAFLLAMLKLGQEGFVGWYWGGMVWENQGIPRLHGTIPLVGHPNSFSGMAVGVLPFIYYYLPIATKIQKLALIMMLFFCVIIIVFTGSRTGYVATCMLGLYFFLAHPRKQKLKILFLAITALTIAIYILPQDYIGRFISIFTLEEKEGASSQARLTIINDALKVFTSHPWGVGVGAFPSVRLEMFGRFQDTHNLYLELLTNLSFLGLAAFFTFIAVLIRTNIKILKQLSQVDHCKETKFLKATSNAIIAFITARLFLGLFGMDTYEIYWWFATGITISLYRSTNFLKKTSKNPNEISHSANLF